MRRGRARGEDVLLLRVLDDVPALLGALLDVADLEERLHNEEDESALKEEELCERSISLTPNAAPGGTHTRNIAKQESPNRAIGHRNASNDRLPRPRNLRNALDVLDNLGQDLGRRTPVADHDDVLPLEVDAMVPPRAVEDVALEQLLAGEVGEVGLAQRSGGRDEDVARLGRRGARADVLDVERPEARGVGPGRVDDERLEDDVVDFEILADFLEVCGTGSVERREAGANGTRRTAHNLLLSSPLRLEVGRRSELFVVSSPPSSKPISEATRTEYEYREIGMSQPLPG